MKQDPNKKEEAGKAQQKKTKAGTIIVNVVLVLAIVLVAVTSYAAFVAKKGSGVPEIFGMRFFSIQTDSMYPTIKAGDLIIDAEVKDPSTLNAGDIITFWTVINGQRVLNTHRIVAIYPGGDFGDYGQFVTRGDNNHVDDDLPVHASSIVGVYRTRIGGLGSAFDFLQSSKGFLLIIVIPVAIFFLWQLFQFFRALFAYQAEKVRVAYAKTLNGGEGNDGGGNAGNGETGGGNDGGGNAGGDGSAGGPGQEEVKKNE